MKWFKTSWTYSMLYAGSSNVSGSSSIYGVILNLFWPLAKEEKVLNKCSFKSHGICGSHSVSRGYPKILYEHMISDLLTYVKCGKKVLRNLCKEYFFSIIIVHLWPNNFLIKRMKLSTKLDFSNLTFNVLIPM